MSLVWAIPVAAAALAAALVVARARAFEDAAVALAREVARLRELRPRLVALRAELDAVDRRADELRERHPWRTERPSGRPSARAEQPGIEPVTQARQRGPGPSGRGSGKQYVEARAARRRRRQERETRRGSPRGGKPIR